MTYPDFDPKLTALSNSLPAAAIITITPNVGNAITVLLDETMPKVTGGYGGWNTVSRQRRVALTEWQGVDPISLTIGIIINGMGPYSQPPLSKGATAQSIETQCAALSTMALPDRGSNHQPPLIKLSSPGNLPFDEKVWVIKTLTWGDGVRDRDSGARWRQQAAIEFLEYIQDTTFRSLSPAQTNRTAQVPAGSFATKNVHVVKAGETLASIAAAAFGKASEWKKLATLNNIRDPLNITIGQRIKLK